MKNRFKKVSLLMAAAILFAGAASDVAYAHSGHHSLRKQTVVYATCQQDGICTQNGICDVNGICQNGGYCINTSLCPNGALCSDTNCSVHHTGSLSVHYSKRGCRSHH